MKIIKNNYKNNFNLKYKYTIYICKYCKSELGLTYQDIKNDHDCYTTGNSFQTDGLVERDIRYYICPCCKRKNLISQKYKSTSLY